MWMRNSRREAPVRSAPAIEHTVGRVDEVADESAGIRLVGKILQTMLAKIPKPYPRGQVIAEQRTRRLGDQDLPTMAG